MNIGSAVAAVTVAGALAAFIPVSSSSAQASAGDGFLFAAQRSSITLHGGFVQPLARSDLFSYTSSMLTFGRRDLAGGSFGLDLAFSLSPRTELVMGFDRSSREVRSEFRDWVDSNDLPIEQSTTFSRTPFTASLRYFFADRGRQVGSVAWIPARFVPFVELGGGVMKYDFTQEGDFIDLGTLNIFADKLQASGWAGTLKAGAGAQYNLNQRVMLTGEMRYLYSGHDASTPSRDFVDYRLDLSGVSTVIGLSFRL